MPKGGEGEGAGRPPGTGQYAESARSIRGPHSLLVPVSEMLAEHLRSVAAERRVSEKQVRTKSDSHIEVPPPCTASVIGPIDATALLCALADQRARQWQWFPIVRHRATLRLPSSEGVCCGERKDGGVAWWTIRRLRVNSLSGIPTSTF